MSPVYEASEAFPVPFAFLHERGKTTLVSLAVQVLVVGHLEKPYLAAVVHDFLQKLDRHVKVRCEQFPVQFVVIYLKILPVREGFKDKAPHGIPRMLELAAQGFDLYVVPHVSVMAEILCVVFLRSCHNLFG